MGGGEERESNRKIFENGPQFLYERAHLVPKTVSILMLPVTGLPLGGC